MQTAEDLDPALSRHHLTTLKRAYLKLRYLVDEGCVFVGHDLEKDFRMINIVVPPSQVCMHPTLQLERPVGAEHPAAVELVFGGKKLCLPTESYALWHELALTAVLSRNLDYLTEHEPLTCCRSSIRLRSTACRTSASCA